MTERTASDAELRQRTMFGCTSATLRALLTEQTERHGYSREVTALDMALSMLSDSQEQAQLRDIESARRTVNRAKWLVDEARRSLLRGADGVLASEEG